MVHACREIGFVNSVLLPRAMRFAATVGTAAPSLTFLPMSLDASRGLAELFP